MRYYINKNSLGQVLPPVGKLRFLLADGAKLVDEPLKFQEDLVCVVDNGFFEAAGYAFNEREM